MAYAVFGASTRVLSLYFCDNVVNYTTQRLIRARLKYNMRIGIYYTRDTVVTYYTLLFASIWITDLSLLPSIRLHVFIAIHNNTLHEYTCVHRTTSRI